MCKRCNSGKCGNQAKCERIFKMWQTIATTEIQASKDMAPQLIRKRVAKSLGIVL